MTGSVDSVSKPGKKQLPLWQETAVLVVFALLIAWVVKSFFVQAFYIPSGSMEPTLQINDKVLVQKVTYWGGQPQRGDVVVFKDPGNWLGAEGGGAHGPVQRALSAIGLYPTGGHLVKRVVAVGGDTVSCCDAKGRLQVNGVSVKEPYLADQSSNMLTQFKPVKIKPGHLWVEGDNRGDSADSRFHVDGPGAGQVPVDDVVGKVWIRVWPFSRFGTVGGTDAFEPVEEKGK